jgi:hypothetical protein
MGEGGIPGGDQGDTRRALTVAQAAEALGVTVDAIRSRIKRRTIEHVRQDGRVYVILGGDQGETSTDQGDDQGADHSTKIDPDPRDRDELVEELRDRVRALEEANRENRRIIAALTSRIPEIEPTRENPSDPRGSSESDEGAPYGTSPQEADESLHRRSSWWRRFFGIE